MSAKDVKLTAFASLGGNWAPCGQLVLTEEGDRLLASSFAYGLNYLNRGNALEVDPVSLGLSDREAVRGKRLLPANQLPFFGGIRDAAPDAWGRRVIEAKLNVPANSLPESQYLLHAGSERVGALDIREGLDAAPTAGASPWHTLAHLVEAAERIDAGLPVPAHLEMIFADGSALGGARPKASVRDQSGVLWLAKFASRNDAFDVPGIESASLVLARHAGLNVPPVATHMLSKRNIMLIKRFDRYWSSPNEPLPPEFDLSATVPGGHRIEHRMGFVSGLTMLGCDEMESRRKSYADLAESVRRYCHPTVIRADNEELFKRMVFNILVSNDDDHLRNHGFLWDPRLRGWRLSPLYDVLPRPSHASERYLHLGIGPQGRLATLDNALAEPERFTLSKATAYALTAQIWQVVRQWRVFFDESGVSEDQQNKIATAFRHIDDVATPGLRKLL
ncbi:type II toxin-antitoxin system HipA family toxin [Pseudazoarcus pumilus]|uniref:Type II toxin-antitoxin system HipA family toxin n=1 Tax=Pseudazoarcus pumilus TaxID=2067960 RepID=A0A2I6S5Y5_9RHOO|nr:HipA domain-containing protein [Pseudazoarcus pumilus]AUN94664.1 type II toxin-antitoxin system HipA family toxin [Pseudazoarcus pumilus]